MRPWIRVVIAGGLGGIAMFFWATFAHLATPLATTGISQIPHEGPLLARMHTTLGRAHGLYLFPRMTVQGTDAMTAYQAKRMRGPSGLLVYHPPGTPAMEASQLVTEFASEFVQCLIAAVLLAWAAVIGYWRRVGFVALVGAAAALTTNLSYWNWYGFPGRYTLAYGAIELLGYVAAGLVIAAVLPRNITNGLWRISETRIDVAVSQG